jgi:hypothetical protein
MLGGKAVKFVKSKINFSETSHSGVMFVRIRLAPPHHRRQTSFQLSGVDFTLRILFLCFAATFLRGLSPTTRSLLAVKEETNRSHVLGRFVLLPWE